jgi:hypothetical protein
MDKNERLKIINRSIIGLRQAYTPSVAAAAMLLLDEVGEDCRGRTISEMCPSCRVYAATAAILLAAHDELGGAAPMPPEASVAGAEVN